jgi:hypothetical protein
VWLGQQGLYLFLWYTTHWESWGTWQHRSSPLGEVRPKPHGTAGAHLDREARSGAEKHVIALELSSRGGRARSHGTRGSGGAHLGSEVRSRVAGHVAAPEPTSVGRCGLKLQLAWQRVDARPAPYLDLELICGGTRSLWCRQRPLGLPQERLRTHMWGQFFGAPLGYLDLFTRQSTACVPSTRKRRRRGPGRCRS